MFLSFKRIIAIILIVAMTFTSVGTSTLASSIQNVTAIAKTKSEKQETIDYRFYDIFKYQRRTSLLLNGDTNGSSSFNEKKDEESSKKDDYNNDKETTIVESGNNDNKETTIIESENNDDKETTIIESENNDDKETTIVESENCDNTKDNKSIATNSGATDDEEDANDDESTNVEEPEEDESIATSSDAEEDENDEKRDKIEKEADKEETLATSSDTEGENYNGNENGNEATPSDTEEIDIKKLLNIPKATTNNIDGELFGATEYVLPNTWYNETSAGAEKQYVESITIEKYPTPAPTSYSHHYEIPGSDGLHVYASVTGSGTAQRSRVTIYAPDDLVIYAAVDSSSMFSMHNNYPYDSNLETITNLHLLDTSRVTNMLKMFEHDENLISIDVSSFVTASVSNMQDMFYRCEVLTSLDVSNFDTSNVTNMQGMFYKCRQVNSIDVSNFDTSKVTDMEEMFADCLAFTSLDVSSFDTSRVTNMSSMFSGCNALTSLDLSNFDTRNVTTMYGMFTYSNSLTSLDISNFDTRNVTGMEHMFHNCQNLATIIASTSFIMWSATKYDMFTNCLALVGGNGTSYANEVTIDAGRARNGDLALIDGRHGSIKGFLTGSGPGSGNGTDGDGTSIYSIKVKASPSKTNYKVLEHFDPTGLEIEAQWTDGWRGDIVYNSTTMNGFTFNPATTSELTMADTNITITYGGADVDLPVGVTGYEYILPNTWYNETLAGAAKEYVETITFAKSPTPAPTTYTHDYEIPGSNGLHVYANVTGTGTAQRSQVTIYAPVEGTFYAAADSSAMFSMYSSSTTHLLYINNLNMLNTSRVTDMQRMFENCQVLTSLDVSSFVTASVSNMVRMFFECRTLTSLDVSSFDTSNVTGMYSMFDGCEALTNINVSSFDTSRVTNMNSMFSGCRVLTSVDVSSFDTSNVTSMNNMFGGCHALTSITGLDTFNTTNVENIGFMFGSCLSLTSLDLRNFDTRNVTGMYSMFDNCQALTNINVSSFDTSRVTNMNSMFFGCRVLTSIDVSSFDTSNVTDMRSMFGSCFGLTTIIASTSFATTSVTAGNDANMFQNCGPLVGGKGTSHANKYAIDPTTADNGTFAYIDGRHGIEGYLTGAGSGDGTTATNIKIISSPSKIDYKETEHFDPTGLEIEVTWDDGYVENVVYNSTTMGRFIFNPATTSELRLADTNIIITYGNFDINFPISITPIPTYILPRSWYNETLTSIQKRNVESITIEKYPTPAPTTYTHDYEIPGSNGLHVYANYTNRQVTIYAPYNGIIYAAADSRELFAFYYMDYMLTIYSSLISITGLDKIDTSRVTNMEGMFYGCRALTSLDLSSFVTASVSDMGSMFGDCENLTSLDLSSFDTSRVTKMSYMFYRCQALTSLDVSSFDTRNVTDMSYVFYSCQALASLDLSGFFTNNITDMSYMFYECRTLTSLDASSFDTRNVTNMFSMFYNCRALTSLDVSNFDTSRVTNMNSMFAGCNALTSIDVSSFDTSNVTNMRSMFSACSALTSITGLDTFNTSNVTDMRDMFFACYVIASFDVSSFVTASVSDMSRMFAFCRGLISLDVSNFDTSNVTNMSEMFSGCVALIDLDVSNFDTSNVTNMVDMFHSCLTLRTIIASTSFATTSVTAGNDADMFMNCYALVGGKGTSHANKYAIDPTTADNGTFAYIDGRHGIEGYLTGAGSGDGTTATNIKIISSPSKIDYKETEHFDPTGLEIEVTWDDGFVSNVTYNSTTEKMFTFNPATTSELQSTDTNVIISFAGADANLPIDVVVVEYILSNTWYNETLAGAAKEYVETITFAKSPTPAPTTYTHHYEIPGSNELHVYANVTGTGTAQRSQVTIYAPISGTIYAAADSSAMFSMYSSSTTHLLNINNLNMLNTSRVTDMQRMFENCQVLTSLDVSSFVTASVSNMYRMFYECRVLTSLDVSSFNTSNVTSMSRMFQGCHVLTSLDVSNFNTSKVTDMGDMFTACGSLTSLDLSNFDTSNVTTMQEMFSNCTALTSIDVSSFDTSNVTSMSDMFFNCSSLDSLDLRNFDTSNVVNMNFMFSDCNSLTTIIASTSFVTTSVTAGNDTDMFLDCDYLVGGKGTRFINKYTIDPTSAVDSTYAWIDGRHTIDGYFTGLGSGGGSGTDGDGTGARNIRIISSPSKIKYFETEHFDPTGLEIEVNWDDGYVSNIIYNSTTERMFTFNPATTSELQSTDTNVIISFAGADANLPIDVVVVEYILSNTWYNETLAGAAKEYVEMITFAKYPTPVPTTYTHDYEIPNDNGLHVYANVTGSGTSQRSQVTIYAPIYGTIYAAADSSNLLSDFSILSSINNLTYLNTSRTINMNNMFANSSSLTNLDVSRFNTNKVTNMSGMFTSCQAITTLDVSGFDTRNVTDMSSMFNQCLSLTNLDVRGFNTSKVNNMSYIFGSCQALTNLDVRGFDTRSVTNMSAMFSDCQVLTSLDVSSFDTRNVTNMSRMFSQNGALTTIKASTSFVTTAVTVGNDTEMFKDCSVLVGGKGTSHANRYAIDPATADNSTYAWIDGRHAIDGYFTGLGSSGGSGTDGDGTGARSIRIISNPSKMNYRELDYFDPAGLEIEVTWDDGYVSNTIYNSTTEKMFTFNPATTSELQLTDTNVVITYKGAQATLKIVINEIQIDEDVSSIKIATLPTIVNYIQGQKFDPSGLAIDIIYNIGSKNYKKYGPKKQVLYDEHANKFSFNPNVAKALTLTDVNVTMTFAGKIDTFEITVIEATNLDQEVSNIKIKKVPDRINYYVDDYLKPWGLVLEVTYLKDTNNLSTKLSRNNLKYEKTFLIDYDTYGSLFSFVPDKNKPLTVNNRVVTVIFGGKIATFNIIVVKLIERGGGGSGRGGTIPSGRLPVAEMNTVIDSITLSSDFDWIYNKEGQREGVKVKKESTLAKSLMSSNKYKKNYKDTGEEGYIQIKNGFYNLQYSGASFYFGFSPEGKMLTGLVKTKDDTEHYWVDENQQILKDIGTQEPAKYYLYHEDGDYKGIIWTLPIVLGNTKYTFDHSGKVLTETVVASSDMIKLSAGGWEYDPNDDSWKFFDTDTMGYKYYAKDEAKEITDNGEPHFYIFGDDEKMQTGLIEYEGKTYYLQEEGPYRGAVYVGSIILDGKTYEFDKNGVMVTALTHTESN